MIVVPTSILDAPLWASMTAILIGGALLMISGLAAVLFVSRRLAADLAAATSAAEAVAEGRPIKEAGGHVAETRQLQRSLTSAASLLEKRARERDAEIQRADAARGRSRAGQPDEGSVPGRPRSRAAQSAGPGVDRAGTDEGRATRRPSRGNGRSSSGRSRTWSRLVNDLLDVSRLARGKVQLERRRFEIRDAVDRAVDMANPLIVQRGHTFDVSVPDNGLTIDADIARIVQVISNLLTNAAKYTPPGGRIALDGERVGRSGRRWRARTTGQASPWSSWRACSTRLPRVHGPSIGAKAGSGWASRWRARSPRCTAARSPTRRLDGRGSRFMLTLPLAAEVEPRDAGGAPVAGSRRRAAADPAGR